MLAAEHHDVSRTRMTKPFRVEETVRALTSALRTGRYAPRSFYALLDSKGIDWRRSVLVESRIDQGPALCGRLIDHTRRMFRFDVEFTGTGSTPVAWGEVSTISEWQEEDLSGEWWRVERPIGTQPQPNDPITIGLRLLKSDGAG